MKKLFFISAIALTMLAACQNETTEMISSNHSSVASQSSAKGEDFLANDGFIHIKSASEVFYMGEQLKSSREPDALFAIELVSNSIAAKRVGSVNCKAKVNGVMVTLVTVTGDGMPPTYWMVTNDIGTNVYDATPYPFGQIGYSDCRALYQAAIY